MPTLPHLIPAPPYVAPGSAATGLPTADQFSLYDVAYNGVGFMYASAVDNPSIRETAQLTKDRVDQAETPGEQTLTGWWIKSQDSFHGGAGQLNLEPPQETPVSHNRFDISKNVDPFTPGLVRRLPDCAVVNASTCTQVVGVAVSGADAVAVVIGGAASLITDLDGAKTVTAFATATTGVISLATDGALVYAATVDDIFALDPAAPATAAVTVASFPATVTTPLIGWAKSRLMAAGDGAIYEVDVSATGVTLGAGELRLQHPTPGWVWRCFSESPAAILAAGDASGRSEIVNFSVVDVAGAPTLEVNGTSADMPIGERVLSLCNVMGTFQAIGTTRGIRVAQYNVYTGALQFGPLELLPTDPTVAANAVVTRDRFAYAVGLDYDEGGLLAVDLATQVDAAGRYAWAPNLICPTTTATAATVGAVLPVSSRIVFGVPGTGLLIEGTTPGVGREAWLRTSRIRYGTTEPKLFKVGSVRADQAAAAVRVDSVTPTADVPLATLDFTNDPPADFRLPEGQAEWLALQFNLTGAAGKLRGYAVKALPGTRRQRRIKHVLSVYDDESTRSGQRIRERLSARDRRDAIEQMDATGDVILIQEFTPSGVYSTLAVIEQIQFTQIGRPTRTSDVGGTASVVLRTVDL